MASRLRYSDAVKLLGGSSPAVQAIDDLLGGVLSAATLGGSDAALSFFDAKAEMVRLGRLAVDKLQDAVRSTARYDRNQRLEAAHGVIVLTALFEAFDEIVAAAEFPAPEITRDDQLLLAARTPMHGDWLHLLLSSPLPVPSPDRSYDLLLTDVADWSTAAGAWFGEHLEGLAEWDRADDRARRAVQVLLRKRLPRRTVAHYEQLHRRLAVDIPEFAVWVDRAESRALRRGLLGLEATLRRVTAGPDPTRHRAALAAAYRAELDRPILGGDSGDLVIPPLGDAYVDPLFQAKECGPGSRPAEDDWWDTTQRGDLADFLVRYLITPWATTAPMLLLGHPGGGKSALTRILAARLPAADFLAVRVVLREVPAEAEIQDQIEYALRAAIGETVAWADLTRSADGAMPVVMLDGFDELLQATGIHQSDYLRRVAEFQRREAVQGRPVAVIVTSRVAVADRARLPDHGLAVRLESFDDEQISRWLVTWNAANERTLGARGLKPLPAEVARRFPDLAGQPLLLLMLALYDATGNALQGVDASFGAVQLYERLLGDFALREVRRWHDERPEDELGALVADELMRLSIVAFAMFNRRRQWVTEAELNADLAGLRIEPARKVSPDGFRSPLTPGQELVGRFFFIQRAQARQDGRALQTYEFLHATFGEYLVARLTAHLVQESAEREASRTFRLRSTSADDELLQSLLGFMPLTARNTVLAFVGELVAVGNPGRVREWLVGRLRMALIEPDYLPREYCPSNVRTDHRIATYSLNLTLLVLAVGDELRASELWTKASDPAGWLRNAAQQWRGTLPSGMWLELMAGVEVERAWAGGRRDLVLRLSSQGPFEPVNPLWSHRMASGTKGLQVGDWFESSFFIGPAVRSMKLSSNLSDDVLRHAIDPVVDEMNFALQQFVVHGEDDVESVAHSLLRLWLVSMNGDDTQLKTAYDRAVTAAVAWSSNLSVRKGKNHTPTLTVLRSMTKDAERLSADEIYDYVERIVSVGSPSSEVWRAAAECAESGGVPQPRWQNLFASLDKTR
jgi:hypothetical protein